MTRRKEIILFVLLMFGNTSFAQLSFTNESSLLINSFTTSGAPIGIADLNGDFRDDLIRLDETDNLYIEYQNADGSFSFYNIGSVNPRSWTLSIADVHNDGYADIMTGGYGSGNDMKLYNANGVGNYTVSNMPGPAIFAQGSNFADINNDGFLDAFICHDNGPSCIWINDGSGGMNHSGNTVIDLELFNSDEDNAGNYGTVWSDFDNDNDIDLYIAKCRLGVSSPSDVRRINQLWVNDGNGNYTESAAAFGLDIGWQSWTADFKDIDNDGDFDLFVSNHDQLSQLFENDNNVFTDITASSGIAVMDLIIQSVLQDFDNDGYVDLLTSGSGSSPSKMYKNNGDKTFTEITPLPVDDIHSFAIGDLNQDGALDIYAGYGVGYNNSTNTTDKLWMNDGNNNNFLAVNLVGVVSNRSAVGAKIFLESALGTQLREVRAGESYGITNSATQNFGMARETEITSLTVKWPSGIIDVFTDVEVNQFLTIREGECRGPDAVLTSSKPGIICSGETIELAAPAGYIYSWNTGETTQEISVNADGDYQVTVSDPVSGCSSVSRKFSVKVDNGACAFVCSPYLNLHSTQSPTTYAAEDYVKSVGTVQNGANVIYQAGDFIGLMGGFEVQVGADFEAIIQTCTPQ